MQSMFAYVRNSVNINNNIYNYERCTMKINNKLDLMLELNQIEKQLKSVKSIVSSSNKHATDCYDFSMTTEEVQNLLVLVARLNEEVQDLKR